MSREFGNYGGGGYMHDKVDSAAGDCRSGAFEVTRLLGEVLAAAGAIAYAASSVEEGDWSEGTAIAHATEHMGALDAATSKLRAYLEPYRTVAEEAICRAADARPTCTHEDTQRRYSHGRVTDTCLRCGHQTEIGK